MNSFSITAFQKLFKNFVKFGQIEETSVRDIKLKTRKFSKLTIDFLFDFTIKKE